MLNEIIIVDDSEFDIFIAKKMFETSFPHVEIKIFTTPNDALFYIKNQSIENSNSFKLIILDYYLKHNEASFFTDEFEKFESQIILQSKIIFLSSLIDKSKISMMKSKSYVLDFLEKPLNQKSIEHIKSFL